MKNKQQEKFYGIFVGLASMMSAIFFLSPPFEKHPDRCEMVQRINRKNNKYLQNPEVQD